MQLSNTPEELQKAFRAIAAIVVVVLVCGVATVAVRASYGAFSDDMKVKTTFSRAGQALHPGSDVKYRGVNVGKVRSVRLVHRKVQVVLQIHKSEKIPASTSASVRAKTLFGEKFIDLATKRGDPGPYLRNGDRVRSGGTGTEVDELVNGTDHLFRSIDVNALATLMDGLTKAYQGEGTKVAHLIDRSVGAADAFQQTLDAQLQAVDSFARFSHEYRDLGPSINAISGNLNEFLPTFNAARQDYERLLTSLEPFSDHLADFVEVNEANIDKILADGDNIVRVVTAHKQNISESIRGLARYTYVLSHAVSPERLPDGSHFGYLKLFIDVGDLQQLVCAALGPTSQASQLSQVREALAAVAPQLACDGDTAPPQGQAVTPSKAGTSASKAGASSDPQSQLTDTVVGSVAKPDQATGRGSVNSLLTPLLGGGG
jgi:virulence factor Mce-like protein